MENVEEQILSYPHLPDERQREIEAYVEEHPEWAPLLRDVRTLESLVRGGLDEGGDASTESLLTAYVLARHFRAEAHSSRMEALFERLEERLESNPSLRNRVNAIRRRLKRAEAKLDPVSHFEEVTGHSLGRETGRTSNSVDTASSTENTSSRREATASSGSLLEWFASLPLAVRGIGATLVVLLGTYAALFVASEASQSTLDRLAAVQVSDQMVESYYSANTRSVMPASDTLTADALYLEALSVLRGARTSTLGLFPSYDSEALNEAETGLKKVLARTEQGSFLALEARFYLGKVYLAQGQVEAARSQFKAVIEQQGRRGQEARRILETLRNDYLEGGNRRQ